MPAPLIAGAAGAASTTPNIFGIAAGQAAGAAGSAAAGGIIGQVFAGANDRRQIRQQKKLNELQKGMTEFNMQKQLEMWEKTGYGATKKQMEEAGLNPALMYGMGGGGGGQSTNVNTAQSQNAPSGGGEMIAAMGMGLNMQLMKSQINLQNSQAEKNRIEAAKTAGVDTQESTARIDMLMQGVDNARQQNEIQKLEITLKNIENFEKQATQENRMDYIGYQTEMAMKQLQLVRNEAYISSSTIREKIKIIQETAIGAVLNNAATTQSISASKTGQAVDQQRIKESVNQIMQSWDKLDQSNREIMLRKIQTDYNTDPVHFKEMTDVIEDIMRSGMRK